jgi:hypothetical protein
MDLNAVNNTNSTALHCAARLNMIGKIVKDKGFFVSFAHRSVVAILVGAGADIHRKTKVRSCFYTPDISPLFRSIPLIDFN